MGHLYKHEQTNVRFIYTHDLSGDVVIRLPKPDAEGHETLRVSGKALVDFMSQWVAMKRAEALAKQTPEQVLGI